MVNENVNKEQWLDIRGWVGLYQVSDKGRIRSLPRTIMRRHGKSMRLGGKVLTPFMKDGYLSVHLNDIDRTVTRRVHRLVMEAFEGPSELEVDHIDRNRWNNSRPNLRYVTHEENMANAEVRRGEDSPFSKLTEDNVREMRREYAEGGISQRGLSEKYGIAVSQVNAIIKRRKWAHVE